MKKIASLLVAGIVLLSLGCENPTVDLAGNPVDLAGSWSGSVSYRDLKTVEPVVTKTVSYYNGANYEGTWEKVAIITKADKDYDKTTTEITTSGTTTTTTTNTIKYLFNKPTVTTTTSRVIESNGSYVETEVVETVYPARAAIPAALNTQTVATTAVANVRIYYVVEDENGNTTTYNQDYTATNIPTGGTVAIASFDYTTWSAAGGFVSSGTTFSIPAELAGTKTVTTTKTVTVTEQADKLFTEVTSKIVKTERSGERYTATADTGSQTGNTEVTTYPDYTQKNLNQYELGFLSMITSSLWRQTVKPTVETEQDFIDSLKKVQYYDTVEQDVTFEVLTDGTFEMSIVTVTTQAAADAAAATETYHAAPAREAGTLTRTTTITGTVAAWESPATDYLSYEAKMVLTAGNCVTEEVGTGALVNNASMSPDQVLSEEYNIRFMKGEGDEETTKTRLYADLDFVQVDVLEKAATAE